MTAFDSLIRDEINRLGDSLLSQVNDPAEKAKLVAMAFDAAMLPARLARGEDIGDLERGLKAEALNRTRKQIAMAEGLALQSWLSVVGRILVGALTA